MWIWLVQEPWLSGTKQYLCIHAWLISLSIMSSRFIHVVASVKILRLYNIPFYLYTMLLLLLLLSRFICVWLCVTAKMAAHQAPRPWNSPGKNTGVGCHFLLQCMKVKSESEIAQSCPTLSNPMDCSLPDSSIHGIFQARLLEWVAIAFSDTPYLTIFSTIFVNFYLFLIISINFMCSGMSL